MRGIGLTLQRRPNQRRGGASRLRLIWDTDLDSDCDDVSATALLGALLLRGEAQLIAAVVASPNVYAAPALRVLLDHIGQASVPVGAYFGSSVSGPSSSHYTLALASQFRTPSNETRDSYANAVAVYRTALVAAPEASVRIIVGGTATNIAALLQSPADGISPLTGAQLVAAKVQSIHVMGGSFAAPTTSESNIALDVEAADYLAQNTPVPVYWAGVEVGNGVMTQIPLTAEPALDPFKKAWDLSTGQLALNKRPSWDLCAVLHAVRGGAGLFGLSTAGTLTYSATSAYTNFTADVAGRNHYLTKMATDTFIGNYLDALIEEAIVAADPGGPKTDFLASQYIQADTAFALQLPAIHGVTWSLHAGADAGRFNIVEDRLGLPAQNFASPTDANGDNVYEVTLRSTSVLGKVRDTPMTVTVQSATGVAGDLIFAYGMTEGVGQTMTDSSTNGLGATLGGTVPVEASDPAWLDLGGGKWVLDFSPIRYLSTPYNVLFDTTSFTMVAVVKVDTVASSQVIAARRDGASGTSWQFRVNGASMDMVVVTASGTLICTAPLTVVSGVWMLLTVRVIGNRIYMRKNGIQVRSEYMIAPLSSNTTAGIYHGAEKNGAGVFGTALDGQVAYSAFYKSTLSAGLEIMAEQAARTAVAAKGIVV